MKIFTQTSKTFIRFIAVMLVTVLFLTLIAACENLPIMEGAEKPTISTGSQGSSGSSDGGDLDGSSGSSGSSGSGISGNDNSDGMDLANEMPPLTGPPAVPIVLMPLASGSRVEDNGKAIIDYSNAADGYVMIKWTGGAVAKGLRVQVIGPSGTTYTYTLKVDNEYEVYPLSDGNGSYTVRVVDLLEDGRGAVVLTANINVALVDEFAPFLRPNQYVNFSENNIVVAKAAELVTANSDFIEKISAIYGFVISNISYDRDLAEEIKNGMHPNYLPDIDAVLGKGEGICFDFAAVMASMLRSQSIPTKLVVGNVNGDLRHAWLNVYSEEEGWIDAVIFFDGVSWQMMDPTFASSGSSSGLRDFIGDGSNYVELYLY